MSRKKTAGHLNISSISDKFDALYFITDSNIDILLTSQTKVGDSFVSVQVRLKGFYTPYRLDRNSKSCFREFIPSRFLNNGSISTIDTMSVKVNLGKGKWLLTY